MSKMIVVLGGDGVGPEVAAVTGDILKKMDLGLEIVEPPCGEQAKAELGTVFPEETMKRCHEADAVLFGAAGDFSGFVLAYLRWGLDNYINIRPVKYYPGALTPLKDAEGIDFVILREGIEGLYPGREGDLADLAAHWPDYRDLLGKSFVDHGPGRFAVRVVTDNGSRRFFRFACEFTQQRKQAGYPGRLVCVTKANVLPQTDGLFYEAAKQEMEAYPGLGLDHFYVDDMSRRILRYPKDLDVVAASNMFGDILSDEAAELVGGLGLAASACLGGRTPYFEPVHGSAPKYAGRNVINPTAMILSAKMMLDHLGLSDAARALEEAVVAVYREGRDLTADQNGTGTTTGFAAAVLKKLV